MSLHKNKCFKSIRKKNNNNKRRRRRRQGEQQKVEETRKKKALPLSATYVDQTTFAYLRFTSMNQTLFNIQELKKLFEIDCLSSTKFNKNIYLIRVL